MPNVLSRVLGTAAVVAGLIAAPVQAALIIWDIDLNGANESPPNLSPGIGEVLITVFTDPGVAEMRIQGTFSGLQAPTTAAHIHCCTAVPLTGTAGVATTTPSFVGFPLNVTSGAFDQTYNMLALSAYNPSFVSAHGGTAAQAWADLFAGMQQGRTYFNVHTSTPGAPPGQQFGFPGGEIRAFLPVQAQVPEPGTLALLGIAGAALAWRRRRA